MPDPVNGEWEVVVQDSNVTAIHSHLIPSGKVLYFHARYPGHSAEYTGYTFDPLNNSMAENIIPVWSSDPEGIQPSALFCSGHTFLSDGRLLVGGGERTRPPVSFRGIKYSFIFHNGVWSQVSKMNKGRWYPQLTRISDGKVVAMSGFKYESESIELTPEWFDPATNLWTEYLDSDYEVPLYNGAYVIPFGSYAGEIFYDLVAWGTPLSQGLRFNPNNQTSNIPRWNTYGGSGIPRAHGNSCMLAIRNRDENARIINIGVKPSPSNPFNCSLIEIGNNLNPQWINIDNMHHDRHDAPNLMHLADGILMVFGGSHTKIPERLDYSDPDPQTWRWQELDEVPEIIARSYHSTALLLKDARVWVGGSRLYVPFNRNEFEDDMERNIEIYSPGYLFDGNRPVITEAPSTIDYNNKFTVKYDVTGRPLIDSVVLISLPSVTHCFDANQKYIILDFRDDGAGNLDVEPPDNPNIAQPGPYMLFILLDKSLSNTGTNRIPSVAEIVFLQL